jgi:hypothetical protein
LVSSRCGKVSVILFAEIRVGNAVRIGGHKDQVAFIRCDIWFVFIVGGVDGIAQVFGWGIMSVFEPGPVGNEIKCLRAKG